jgi:hypothetical protein
MKRKDTDSHTGSGGGGRPQVKWHTCVTACRSNSAVSADAHETDQVLFRWLVWMHQLLCVGALVQEALGFCLSLSRLAGPASSVLELRAPCRHPLHLSRVPQYHRFMLNCQPSALGCLLQCRKPRHQRHPQQATLQDHPGLDRTLAHLPTCLTLSLSSKQAGQDDAHSSPAQHSTV